MALLNCLQAPDNLFAQPQFMSQMQRVYGSTIDVAAVSASVVQQPLAAAASLPPLPRPSAAVAFRSAALVPVHSAPEDGASSHVTRQTAAVSHPPPPALVERNYNPPASAPAATAAEEDLGSAWGITDPRTLAALKKREAKFKGKDALRRQKEVSFKRAAAAAAPPHSAAAGHGHCRRALGVLQDACWCRRHGNVIGKVGCSSETA